MSDPVVPAGNSANDPSTVEVGASGKGLRIWYARKALEQAEAALKAQAEIVSGMRSRATALLGWTVTALLALGAAVATRTAFAAAAAVSIGMILSAVACLAVLIPATWTMPAWDVGELLSRPYTTELQMVESMARGSREQIEQADAQIGKLARALRAAYVLFALAPFIGLIVLWATSS